MAHGIRHVTKNRPCPICGKPDWCGFMPADDYGELVLCQRAIDGATVTGYDGQTYVCVGKSRSDIFIFEEINEKARKDAERGRTSSTAGVSGTKKVQRQPVVVDEVLPLFNDALDKVYRYMLDQMVLDEQHREWLIKEGWSQELIEANHIKTMPLDDFKRYKRKRGTYYSQSPWRKSIAKACAEKFATLRGVPGFYRKKNYDGELEWTISARSGICFPQYDIDGRIVGIRIRMDFQDAAVDVMKSDTGELFFFEDEMTVYICMKGLYHYEGSKKVFHKETGKYRPLTSFDEDDDEYKKGFIVNKFLDGCQAPYTFGWYSGPTDNMYVCYLTEGEKKGILGNAVLKAPFIALPGVNGFSSLTRKYNGKRILDILKERGVQVFIVAFDADKVENSKVLASERKTIDLLKSEGFMVGVANWDPDLGKGIDDLLKNGHKPKYTLE